jgi:hypothetical protein
VLNVTSSGNLGATRDLIIPAIEKQYFVENNTSGGQSIRVKTAAGTGVTIPNGRIANVFCDGTNTRFADDFVDINGGAIDGTPIGSASASTGAFTTATITTATISGGTINNTSIGATTPSTGAFTTVTATTPIAVTSGGLGLNAATQGDIIYSSASNTYVRLAKSTDATRYLANTGASNNPAWAQINLLNGVVNALPVANGGTGAATLAANNVLLGNGTTAVQTVAPGTTGNLLTSNGTTWTSAAPPTSFISGMIIMWSGSIASIPSGWALCNGSNGTPDLRDRFVVGAGSSYAVAATGGSKDAIVVSHTHTFSATTSTAGDHNHNVVRIRNDIPGSQDGALGGYSFTFLDNIPTTTAGSPAHTVSGTTDSTGSSGTNANLPPYYALAFIMKT